MPNRPSDPPGTGTSRSSRESTRVPRLRPEQYEVKIRWDRARRVVEVTSVGVKFDFDSALKVGTRYPVSVTAPGVSIASTLEVTRCQLIVETSGGRYFHVEGKFFPYVE
jgi:hypothetical protein